MNSNSWHFKLCKHWYPELEYTDQVDTCSYFWYLVGSVIWSVFIGSIIIVIFTSSVILPVGYLVQFLLSGDTFLVNWRYLHDTKELFTFLASVGGVLLTAEIVVAIVFALIFSVRNISEGIRNMAYYKLHNTPVQKEEPGVISTLYKSWKEKTCVIMEIDRS